METADDIIYFLICFWPIWLGIPFVIVLAKIIAVPTWQRLYIEQKALIYASMILIFSLFSFLFSGYLISEISMVFSFIGHYTAAEEYTENRDLIRQELWLRIIMPPSEKGCFSDDTICYWADEVERISGGGDKQYSYSEWQQWLAYILHFVTYGLPVGLGFGVLFYLLLRYRSRGYPIRKRR